jgi:hypothetical protein
MYYEGSGWYLSTDKQHWKSEVKIIFREIKLSLKIIDEFIVTF